MEDDEEELEEESAKFNMAIATLKDLAKNLEEQRLISYSLHLTPAQKQIQRINLVRQFFIRASPLLPNKTVEKYKDEVLKLKPPINKIMKFGMGMSASIFIGYRYEYSEKLEYRLDEIMIELQQVLQIEKYFMPPKEDEGLF